MYYKVRIHYDTTPAEKAKDYLITQNMFLFLDSTIIFSCNQVYIQVVILTLF